MVQVYEDRSSGARASRPGLDRLLADARRGKFEVVVWACDRLARSVTHFLQVLDELNHLGIEFVSFREQLDTGGPLGRAMVVIISAIAELERNLIIERVKAGLRSEAGRAAHELYSRFHSRSLGFRNSARRRAMALGHPSAQISGITPMIAR